VVVAALRADILVFLQISFVQNRLTARAFDPQPLRHTAALGRVSGGDFWGEEFF